MKYWKLLLLFLLVVSLISACAPLNNPNNQPTEKSQADQHAKGFALIKPIYPKMAPYPDENQYIKSNGEFDSEGFDKVYSAWSEAKQAQKNQRENFNGNYQDFFSKTAKVILKDPDQTNQAYSPISLYMALSMLAGTTDGETKSEILNTLGEQEDSLVSNAKALWNANYSSDTASNSVLANSLWLNNSLAYQETTIKQLAEDYYASVFQGPMGSDDYSQALQNWINQETGNLLTEQSKNLKFIEETVLGLVSTIYFQQKWANEFFPDNNTRDTFYGKDQDVEVQFMHQNDNDIYYWADNFGAVHKQLHDGSSCMWFILPDEDVTIDQVLDNPQLYELTSKPYFNQDWKDQKSIRVNLAVPKFDVSAHYNLNQHLETLGIKQAFNVENADFSPLLQNQEIPVWLSQAEQGTRVVIDEQGVTAASFTAMQTAGAAAPITDEIDFILNRPFLFVISGIAGDPIFIGVVNQL